MNIKMIDLFKRVGLDINSLEENKPYDISDKNIQLLAYDFNTKSNVYKKVSHLVYKGHWITYSVNIDGKSVFRGNENHKIYDIEKGFVKLKQTSKGKVITKEGIKEYTIKCSKETEPIVDLQIEGKNYFTSGVLSHNTVLHVFLPEAVDEPMKLKEFIKTIMFNTELPSITITPTFSHCHLHGYLAGDTGGVCPKCKELAIAEYQKKLVDLEKKEKSLENQLNETSV